MSQRSCSLYLGVMALAVAAIGRLAATPVGQQPSTTPSFRSGVQMVLVDVIVRDKKTGALVTNLTKDDFENPG